MEEFNLKVDSIAYLEPKIIEQYAKVKLTSLENDQKLSVWINPLCLAALCPTFAKLQIEDQESIEIFAEHSILELEHLVKFCHRGQTPKDQELTIFQDLGIKVFQDDIDHEPKEDWFLKTEPPDFSEFDFAEDLASKVPVEGRKRGRPKATNFEKTKKSKIREDDDDWEPEWQDLKVEKEDVLDDNVEHKVKLNARAKCGRKRKSCEDLIAAEKNSMTELNPEMFGKSIHILREFKRYTRFLENFATFVS